MISLVNALNSVRGLVRVKVRHTDLIRDGLRAPLFRESDGSGLLQRLASLWQVFPLKEVMLSLGLVLVMVLTALGVVYSSYISRELFTEQAMLQERNDLLQLEWAQLLLEQSAFTSPGQIENVAANELNMVLPDVQNVELVH